MATVDTGLRGWPAAFACTEDAFNAAAAARIGSGIVLKDTVVSGLVTDLTYSVSLTINTKSISINADTGDMVIVVEAGNSSYERHFSTVDTVTYRFPEQFQLKIVAPLLAVTGELVASPDASPEGKSGIYFQEKPAEGAATGIKTRLEIKSIALDVPSLQGTAEQLGVAIVLKREFRRRGVVYDMLPQVSRSVSAPFALKPRSFSLSAGTSSRKEIFMWCALEGASQEQGVKPTTSKTPWNIQSATDSPLESELNSVIIISQRTLLERLIQPWLHGLQFENVSLSEGFASAINASVKFVSDVTATVKGMRLGEWQYEEFSFPLKEANTALSFMKDKVQISVTKQYKDAKWIDRGLIFDRDMTVQMDFAMTKDVQLQNPAGGYATTFGVCETQLGPYNKDANLGLTPTITLDGGQFKNVQAENPQDYLILSSYVLSGTSLDFSSLATIFAGDYKFAPSTNCPFVVSPNVHFPGNLG